MECEDYFLDPRQIIVNKLIELGLEERKAGWIALDVGMDAVGREYLKRCGIKGKKLKNVERLITDFYLGRLQ